MTYRPGKPALTRQLIAALAVAPEDPTIPAPWASRTEHLARSIRDSVDGAGDDSTATLAYELILHWRNELDRLLTAFEREHPLLWTHTRMPGTWLDSLLRLRSVLTHVVSKAYWSADSEIPYEKIEIERYLWGAR